MLATRPAGPKPSTNGAAIRARPTTSSIAPCSGSESRRNITRHGRAPGRPHCALGHAALRYRVAPCPGSASTACWPSVACSRPARAPPRRCWPARCTSVPGAPGRPSRASSWPTTSRSPSTLRRRTSRAAGSSSPTRSTRWRRRGRAPRARRRRLDRRLHRLPAAARRRARVALDVAYGELDWRLRERRARDRDRARQRARARRRRSSRTRPT